MIIGFMGRFIDLAGTRVLNATYKERLAPKKLANGQQKTIWKMLCDCGKEYSAAAGDIQSGRSTSCGCYQKRLAKFANTTHNQRGHELYESWFGMIERCRNPKNHKYHRYGARGIKVCEEWKSFENFLRDMSPRPSKSHTLDRINNDGDYEPSNCRWATAAQQSRNTGSNVWIEINGERMIQEDWCRRFGINSTYLRNTARARNISRKEALLWLKSN
jgi:hypothetical protein